jgi:hypothetical protein
MTVQPISRFPIVALLHPRERTALVLGALAVGLALGAGAVTLGRPLWVGTALALTTVLAVGALKWRDDLRRYGGAVTVLSVLLVAQGFHSIEHGVQEFQYHILKWPPFASSGLISAANAEWVHFVWNWLVVAVIAFLVLRGGMRNVWAWLLLAWSLAHAVEHAYMFARYLEMRAELGRLGFPALSAQGLPGILGRDGWLARSEATQGTFLCRLPGATTAPRIDVHFWWNAGEIVLLLAAAHVFLRSQSERMASAAKAPRYPERIQDYHYQ